MSAEMKNTLVESKLLRDDYRCVKHASGLTVFIYPKAEMRSTYAVFGTRYGSIDKVFKRSDEAKAETTPAGIAHFLEHKLFESEDGDAFGRYAEIGASANAYTSFETTRYLFSCTETQSRHWRFCSTSCSPRILQSRPLKKSSASSARKSKCMTMTRSGA